MFLMFFCISFVYTILRDTKDTLIVTGSGAETIPFLKVWGVVPGAIIFTLIYAKLSNILSKERLFYVTIMPFLVFFALFAVLIYPNREALHPHAFADFLQSVLPVGFAGLIGIFRNWTYSLFYILAELWGSAVLSLMFWGFANDIMRVSEAKRFYTLLGLGANIALLFSGQAIVYFSDIRKHVPAGVDAWQISLNYLMALVVLAGIAIIGLYWWINRNVLTDSRFYDPADVKKAKEKPKMSMLESMKFLINSKYMLCLAFLVIAYGVAINLFEVSWKGQLKLQYPNPNDYSAFMGNFSFFTGVTTIVMMFIGGYIIRKKGWGFGAMMTPVVLLITGVLFYTFVIFGDHVSLYVAMLGTTPLFLGVMIGAAQNIMSKSTKYALFDPTKEMAYIPLDQESKVKGKAAIDVLAARLGKSGGSMIQQGLLVVLGTMAAITPYVAGAAVVMIIMWMFAVRVMNRKFVALTELRAAEELQEAQEKKAAQTAHIGVLGGAGA